jgi:hypothetical protein
VIEPHCAHAGEPFRPQRGCGIRCIYHGWKYDVDGKCVDMPNVPPGSGYHGKISIRAYPTREFGDLVWAYLGPRERVPDGVPQLEFGVLPPSHRYVTKRLQQCNWAQSMEGALDTAHFSFLHMPAPQLASNENPNVAADERRLRWLRNDPLPQFTVLEHNVGFVVGGSRRADGQDLYWRVTQFMLPAHSITPSAMPGEIYYGYTWVPTRTSRAGSTCTWHPDRPLSDAERTRFDQGGYGQMAALGPGFVPLRNRSNDYLIDREEQKHRSFTGVRGIAEQDAMAQDSQGLIVDRTREHLTPTDVAIVRFRRLMLESAKALRDGKEPAAAQRHESYHLRSGGAVAPSSLSFEAVMQERFGSSSGRVSS